MINVAIIGAGAISNAHISAYMKFPERCRIVAVVDVYMEKAQKRIEEYGLHDAVAVADYHELLQNDIDLVSICTPPYTHASIACDFMKAGKHVLVEKPMASSLEEADQMLKAAQDRGTLLSVIAQNRFTTPMMKLKSVLDSRHMGPILHVQVDSYWWRGHSYYDLWWRGTWEKEGGGCTLNHAVHHLDAMLWMMGAPIEVQAMMANTAHDNAEVEDISMAMLRFSQGAVGMITSSVVHHGEEQQLIFQGKEARVSVPWKVVASTSQSNGFPEPNPDLERKLQQEYDALPEVIHSGHAGQVENVLDAIEYGTSLVVDGESGRNTLELIVGIYKSASTGEKVVFPIPSDDTFYSRESMIRHVVHFYEKKSSVENFEDIGITLGRRLDEE
ncbi:Gfo/Idh/MocA family protein [Paenibacillus cucumis (ex Kampfer et al. 2016)]|uniref:Gfo/Idh/MocA family oxidoreductase n=1 Tax=Paenibacillus cucumis (ex Kampfer et al. 2016) TaxID=1776858 RepID=A0ABS7KNE5_9BACL|nr:Gfo/Idh/MocA family oxidoreductase [Paenibacillus cucumis (ex Kampfer et al. 2016)]MBY0205486.1 Gfo/Idh/MocA family oxidoreductase [Paenibacillus cucumis (ex Kampfer et al. 2016)]